MEQRKRTKGTNNKAKEYLQQIQAYDERIDAALFDVECLEALLKRMTTAMNTEGASSGGAHDKIGDTVPKIVDLKNQINRDINAFVDLKREARKMLGQLKNPVYFKILHSRYFKYKSLQTIADEIGYDYRWTRRLHGRALQAFEKVMKE